MRNAVENRKAIIPVIIMGMMISLGFLMILVNVQGDIHELSPSLDMVLENNPINDHEITEFIENGGQWDDDIRYASKTSFGHMALGRDFILYDVRGETSEGSMSGSVFRMDLIGTNEVEPEGSGSLPYRTNILVGNDPSRWGTNLGSYGQVIYEDIWDGIDLSYSIDGNRLKYEYSVRPGADPDDIRFRIHGSNSIKVTDGALEMVSANGISLFDSGLVSFYKDSPEKTVSSVFDPKEDGSYGFDIPKWDEKRTLVIDPFIYSTYIGGATDEYEINMDRDADGNIYLVGDTQSFDFPTTPGAFCTRLNREIDGWVMKLDPDGSGPVFSTFIGGNKYDSLKDIKADSRGDIYLGGMTMSDDFPTTRGAFNETLFGSYYDLVAVKLDSSGSSLDYSTYIGGNGTDEFYSSSMIQLDDRGCLYITGQSMSSNYPVTEDAYDKYNNVTSGGHEESYTRDLIPPSGSKVVLTKLNPTGTDLEYSTFLGGKGNDNSCGISLEGGGSVFIMGTTTSQDFPVTKGAYKTSFTSWMTKFITKLDTVRSDLVYSTFFGTDEWEDLCDITHDSSGRVIITGGTSSSNWPVSDDAYCRENQGYMDAFVTALDPTGSKIAFSTFVGGEKEEFSYSICLDDSENIYITGSTMSEDYPKLIGNKTPETEYDSDVFITVLNQTCAQLIYSTVVGGGVAAQWSPFDEGKAIIPSGDMEVVVAGVTSSTDFPVTGDAADDVIGGGSDTFFSIFDLCRFPEEPQETSIEQGNAFLNISWEEPVDDGGRPIVGYSIYRGEMEALIDHHADTTEGLFFNDTDLEIGKTYYYFVRAYSQIGEGKPTSIVHSLAISAPTPPQFLQVQGSNGWTRISWEPPVFNGAVSIQGYKLYKYTQQTDTTDIIDIPSTELDHYDLEVVNGYNYTYRVTAYNRIGESNPTEGKWVIPKGEPSSPQDLTIQNGPGFAMLSWSPPEDDGGSTIMYYRVYQGTILDEEVIWRYVNAHETNFNDTLVDVGRNYLYYVTAVNSEGESIPSNTVEAVPQSEPSPPENIGTSEGNRYVTLTWDEPSYLGGIDLEGYRIYRSEGDLEKLMILEVGFDTQIHKDKNLVNGREYTYTFTAFNSYGESVFSDEVKATPATVPAAPTSPAAASDGQKIIITWDALTGNGGAPILEYSILRKIAGGDLESVGAVGYGDTSFTDEDLEAGKKYYYAVKAKNRMGYSDISEEVEAAAIGPPGPPVNLDLASGDGYVEIMWSSPLFDGGNPITKYIVERGDPELEILIIAAELGPQEVYYKDETVENGGQYLYRVIAVNGIGSTHSDWSDVIKPLGLPGAPASIVTEVNGNEVTIRWAAPECDGGCEIRFYRIYRTSEDGETEQIGVVEGTVLEFTDSDEKDTGTYTYNVVAVNSVGQGEISVKSDAKVDPGDKGSFIGDNIGLLITIPIIILLLVLLVLILAKKRGNGYNLEGGPQPTPVIDQPDPNGYPNGYQDQAIGTDGAYDHPNPAGYNMEQ